MDASLKSGGHYIYHQEVFCTIGVPYLRTAWNWTIVVLLSATVIVDGERHRLGRSRRVEDQTDASLFFRAQW